MSALLSRVPSPFYQSDFEMPSFTCSKQNVAFTNPKRIKLLLKLSDWRKTYRKITVLKFERLDQKQMNLKMEFSQYQREKHKEHTIRYLNYSNKEARNISRKQ